MNQVSSVAERALLSVDHFLSQVMTYAWTSTLERRPSQTLLSFSRSQPPGEEDYGGGDICSPEASASTGDDQSLD